MLFATIVALVATKYFQDKYSAEHNVDNCGSISVTMSQAFEDYNLGDRSVGLMSCYCYS